MQGFCKTCIAALFLIPLTISAAAAEWGLRRLRDGIRVFMRLCHEQRCDNLVRITATLAAKILKHGNDVEPCPMITITPSRLRISN